MTGRLIGKTAFITAAGAGIGAATAQAFLDEGARVIATDLKRDTLAALPGVEAHALDVRSSEAVEALAKRIGAIDILFNCAGFVHHGNALDTSEADWALSFDLNVTSMFRTIHAFLPAMLEAGGGSIVNIASVASSVRGLPNRYVYGASKAAVIGLTKAVAADFILRGIRCNAICPGTVQSPSLDVTHRRSRDQTTGVTQDEGSRELREAPADGPARHRARDRDAGRLSSPPTRASFTTGQAFSGGRRGGALGPCAPHIRPFGGHVSATRPRCARRATPVLRIPSTPAAPVETSRMRPRTNGPRSFTVTMAERVGW